MLSVVHLALAEHRLSCRCLTRRYPLIHATFVHPCSALALEAPDLAAPNLENILPRSSKQLLVPQNPRDWFGSGPLLRRVQGRVWVKEILQVWEIYPSKLYPPDAPFSFTARLLVPNQNHRD